MLAHSVNLSGGDFMSKVVNGRIILDKEESKNLLKDIFHPDVEALKKRDAFIEGTKNWTIQRLGNGRTIIDIPDLNLSPLNFAPSKSGRSDECFVSYSKQTSSNNSSIGEIPVNLPSPKAQYNNIARLTIISGYIVNNLFQLERHTKYTNSDFSPLGFYKENSLDRSVCYNV